MSDGSVPAKPAALVLVNPPQFNWPADEPRTPSLDELAAKVDRLEKLAGRVEALEATVESTPVLVLPESPEADERR